MTYHDCLNRLVSLFTTQRGILHLANMQALCESIGNPQNSIKTIHVAGTNGKGSVCSMIASGLAQETGKKVGLYTSPHLNTFRERVQINRIYISEEKVAKLLNYLFAVVKDNGLSASFFEITTTMAFLYFAENAVDAAVIETGLGGRFDATNVIIPILSVITSISLEHTEFLGQTLEAIANEKAGIIKKDIPIVIGPTVPMEIIAPIAGSLSSPLSRVENSFDDYREENRAVARQALRLLNVHEEFIDTALHSLPSCRFERHFCSGTEIIFDVAHNPVGMEKLVRLLQSHYLEKKFTCIIAVSKTKNLEDCLKPLLPHCAYWHPVEAPNGRSYSYIQLREILESLEVPSQQISQLPSITDAVAAALKKNYPILVCGTFFIMNEARRAAGILEPHDLIDMNERSLPQLFQNGKMGKDSG